jgi:hypothetical protein
MLICMIFTKILKEEKNLPCFLWRIFIMWLNPKAFIIFTCTYETAVFSCQPVVSIFSSTCFETHRSFILFDLMNCRQEV